MNSYATRYYFLGTDEKVDYYLAEPKANKTIITNYCELNVVEHDKFYDNDEDKLIASMYHFGDNSILRLEDFLSLKNDNLSDKDRIRIFNVCKEINQLMLDDKVDVNIIKNVFDKWKIVEEIFTKSNKDKKGLS